MPAVPVQRTWTDGDALTTTNLNGYISDPLGFLLNKPRARLRQTVAQTLTNAVWTPIVFDTEDLDTDPDGVGGHSTTVNPSRYVARYPGWYQVGGGVGLAGNGTGYRAVRWAKNGSVIASSSNHVPPTSVAPGVTARSILTYLGIGDYAELQAVQTSGGPLDTVVLAELASSMDIVWASL